MGEEYGEPAPFQYFVSHGDPALVEAVRRGRREEFAGFPSRADAPDPFAESTFDQCVLHHDLGRLPRSPHQLLLAFYRELIHLRKTLPALVENDRDSLEVQSREAGQAILLHYQGFEELLCVFAFADEPLAVPFDLPPGEWHAILDSAAPRWGGKNSCLPGTFKSPGLSALPMCPRSVAVFQNVRKG
jgi:maltooligosyltrehalose trehalohydrolase